MSMIPTVQSISDASAPPSLLSEPPSMEPLPPRSAQLATTPPWPDIPKQASRKKFFGYFVAASFFFCNLTRELAPIGPLVKGGPSCRSAPVLAAADSAVSLTAHSVDCV